MEGQTEEEPFDGMTTYIDYNADYEAEATSIQGRQRRESLGSRHPKRVFYNPNSPHCTYSISQPPYEVQKRLETQGYKVVGTNNFLVYHMWTLCKQA